MRKQVSMDDGIFLLSVALLCFSCTSVYHILSVIVSSPLIYFALTYLMHVKDLNKYPPGPFPLPIIGNFHLIYGKPLHLAFKDLRESYGDVYSISLGMYRMVIANSFEPAHEILVTKGGNFVGRPLSYTDDLISRGGLTISLADNGPYWITTRKLGASFFHQFAKGNRLEELTATESDNMKERLCRLEGKPVDPTENLGLTITNVLFPICLGNRYDEHDEEYKDILKFLKVLLLGSSSTEIMAVVPFLKYLPHKEMSHFKEAIKKRDDLLHNSVLRHVETFNPENCRDMVDCLLNVRNDKALLAKAGLTNLSYSHIEMILHDYAMAGIETTLAQIRWAILYLVRWPQYQDMMYKEIADVCGPNAYPTMKDKNKLVIVQGCTQETMRLGVVNNVGFYHQALEDDTISGFPIPKGTPVLANIWGCHHDEKEWENPYEFNPLRWLDENGKYDHGRQRGFFAFSAGRRHCTGESIARSVIFIMLTRLVKDFRFEYDPEHAAPSIEPRVGFGLFPAPFDVIFHAR